MDSLEYQLNEPGDIEEEDNKKKRSSSSSSKNLKIALIVFITLSALFLAGFITFLILYETKDNKQNNNISNVIYKTYEISFPSSSSTIKNTFKEGGENYISELPSINDGNDYQRNDKNVYYLYIPKTAIERKDKYNKIFLFLHGGAWLYGSLDQCFDYYDYCSLGFITATVNYTLLNQMENTNYNVFRILDEITAAIQDIKSKLKKEGFNEDKLEMVIGGVSSGAHLALLYAYMMKNHPIPIKYAVDYSGPMTLDYDYWLEAKNESLDNIDYNSIEKAKKENKIGPIINDAYTHMSMQMVIIVFNNIWQGRRMEQDMEKMFINDQINKDSQEYKELISKNSKAFPINYISNSTVPTISIRGGKDNGVGIAHYSLIQKKFEESGNKNLKLIYDKDIGHEIYISFPTCSSIRNRVLDGINEFSNKYLHKD